MTKTPRNVRPFVAVLVDAHGNQSGIGDGFPTAHAALAGCLQDAARIARMELAERPRLRDFWLTREYYVIERHGQPEAVVRFRKPNIAGERLPVAVVAGFADRQFREHSLDAA